MFLDDIIHLHTEAIGLFIIDYVSLLWNKYKLFVAAIARTF